MNNLKAALPLLTAMACATTSNFDTPEVNMARINISQAMRDKLGVKMEGRQPDDSYVACEGPIVFYNTNPVPPEDIHNNSLQAEFGAVRGVQGRLRTTAPYHNFATFDCEREKIPTQRFTLVHDIDEKRKVVQTCVRATLPKDMEELKSCRR